MPTAIELFSGCGGLSTGLIAAGFNILSAVEINPIAAQTYSSNHPNVNMIIDDIRNITSASLLRLNNLKRGHLDLLAGCSPCQGFSRLRKGSSGEDDERNKLLYEFVRIVRGVRPKTIFMENVPGIITTDYGLSIFNKTLSELSSIGYTCNYTIIDTADYGVPQHRKRFILLGTRYKQHILSIPETTHTSPLHPVNGKTSWVTVRQALLGVPALANGATDPNIPLHRCSKNGTINLQRIQSVPHDGGSRSSFPANLVLPCHKNYPNGFRDVYGRMHWDQPAPTITSGCTNITRGRFIHPAEDRGISLYEAALLQSFPSNYIFSGNFSEKSLQIGNAVPVKLAETIGLHIIDYLNLLNS